MRKLSKSGGFSLVEVLVALFVLALGILGAAGMQATALRMRQESGLMSRAVELAGALADRMRANALQMHQSDGANAYLGVNYEAQDDNAPTLAGSACHVGAAACDSAQLARFDVYDIEQELRASLPGGHIVVCRDSAPWDAGTGALSWACSGAATAPIIIKLGWRARRGERTGAADPAAQSVPSVAIMLAGVSP